MASDKYSAKSMTAFAKTQTSPSNQTDRFSWEIRSVNQRYLEINPRLPDAFKHLENDLRNQLKAMIHRGKIDISLSYDNAASQTGMQVNMEVLQPLTQAINQVQQTMPEATQVNPLEILQWPGVLQQEQSADKQKLIDKNIIMALTQTIEMLNEHRQREGQALAQLILDRCELITEQLNQLEPELPNILQNQVSKLKERILNLTEQVDEQRLHQEIAMLAQKMDVAEEVDRLRTHLNEVQHILTQDQQGKPIGRRLDFLMQELNREANTLGSKSIDQKTSQTSVELKVLIEQMREQVQNIE